MPQTCTEWRATEMAPTSQCEAAKEVHRCLQIAFKLVGTLVRVRHWVEGFLPKYESDISSMQRRTLSWYDGRGRGERPRRHDQLRQWLDNDASIYGGIKRLRV